MASFKGKMRFMRQLSYSIQRSFEQSHFNEKRLETFLRCKKLSDVMKTPIVSYATAPGISSVTRHSGYGSKYHPLSALEMTEEKMREKFFNSKSFSYDKWEEIKLELMSECLILTEENFDSVLMNSLLYLNNYELATSFMQYLKQSKKRPNFVTYLKYMIVCSKNVEMCKQDTILDIYDKIKSQLISSPVLDNSTVDCIIQGLAVTDRWEESFEYLEKLPDNNPKLDTKNSLTYAALRNKNTEMAWDMLQNWYSKHEDPSNRVFIQYLKLVVKTFYFDKQEANLLLEKLFNYMISRNIVMKMSLVDQVADYFKM